MLMLLLVLFGTLVYVVQNSDSAAGTVATPSNQELAQVNKDISNTKGILIPVFRIEEGTKLSKEMFRVEEVSKEQVPPGAYLSDNQEGLVEKYSKRIINPNIPLLVEDVSDVPPSSAIQIPPGFRLITIIVDSRSGVEGWAKPGTRVDVLWTFVQELRKKVATIARFVKVVSVAGNSQSAPEAPKAQVAGPVTVSLLVTEDQAKYIELARTSGDLSLVLVGDREIPSSGAEKPEVFDINDLIKPSNLPEPVVKEEIPPDGMMITTDPKTGKPQRFVLMNGRWALDKGYNQ